MSQANLQSKKNLLRKVYLNPAKELKLSVAYLIELVKALYVLAEFGNYGNRTIGLNLRKYLAMKATTGDLSVSTNNESFGLIEMIGPV